MQASRFRLETAPAAAAALAILVAGVVLTGWILGSDLLTRILPASVAMNPMTAVAFVLAAISLWLQRSPAVAPARDLRRLHLARLAAAAVIMIGLLRLVALVSGADVGVDEWLFADRLAGADVAFPNRMAPNTALNFVLLGLALATLDTTTSHGRRPAESLASAVFLIALLALTGYAYRVPEFTGVASFIPMALPTAAVFASLAAGVFVARQDSGMMAVITGQSLGGVMARGLLPVLVLAILMLGWLRLEGERRGFYGPGLGVALYTVTNIMVISTLIWWSARSLHLADAERANLAAQQRDSEAQVRLLLDSTAEAIYGIDVDGHCTFSNRACVRMLGYTDSGELLGKDMHALIHHSRPDGTPYTVADCCIYRAVRADSPAHVDDEVFWRADGSSFAVEYWSYPMRRDDGPVGAVVTFLDITERRQAEERLRQSEERTRAIIETASDAFISIDADGIVIGWNRQAETMFGWMRDEAVGRRLSDMIVPEQYRAGHEHGLRRFAASGAGPVLDKRIEITALRRDGEEFPVELAIWPVHAEGGHTFNAFVHDITERKRAADSILALNAELGASAVQLQQTNRELEAFSYTISHDLRAPLRHIDGYARMLHEDAGDQLDADMRRYLDTISDSARQMGALIDDLLAFSRLGRKPVERTEVDMHALLERVVQELGGADRVSLGALPAAQVDPVLLKQVWVNLLSNALKYSAPRGDAARIEISGEHGDGIVRYQIRDNGVGFDMRYADKLFGVFQRLHSHDEFEGTGVGLAIVQRIVLRHGGAISAQAEPGRGAIFTFELPVIGGPDVRGHDVPEKDVPAVSATEASA